MRVVAGWLQGRSEPCWLATERCMSKVSSTQDADVEHQYPVQSKSMYGSRLKGGMNALWQSGFARRRCRAKSRS